MKNLFYILFLTLGMSVNAQVAINTDGSLPDNSAMLDVKSTDKGLLIPRMTVAQRDAIVSPATGLLIFCTDNNLYFSNKGTPGAPNWVAVNSQWSSGESGISYGGGNVGIGTLTPSTILDIMGGNNWDLINGEGDFRLGNSQYRIKMGVALGGGGAGAAGIMQYGQPGGYNVLKFGAQGSYLLFINGSTQKVGIGTDNPAATLDIQGTLRVADGSQGAGKVLTSDAGGTASWTSTAHYIGEGYGGGIVFYVYDNGKHGLIAATSDQSTFMRWYAGTGTNTMAFADGVGAGKINTALIIASQGYGDGNTYAARISNEVYSTVDGVNFSEWYLPSKYELNLLYQQRYTVGGFAYSYYWTSTEADATTAWCQTFSQGYQGNYEKGYPFYVRVIRSF